MKLKTHKATQKRVQFSKTGKIMRVKSAKSHLLSHKLDPIKVKIEVSRADRKRIKQLAPNK